MAPRTADAGGAWSFAPVGLADGSYSLTATETDLGRQHRVRHAFFTLDTTAPAAPGAPDLAATSDHGASNTDNITNATTPTFTGTAAANATVTLLEGGTFNSSTVIGSGQADAAGAWSIATNALAAGVHVIAAKATDVAGNVSVASAPLSVTIDVTAPGTPSTPDLTLASDSGASKIDNITNVVKPIFTGVADPNTTVTLLDGTTAVGTGLADAFGNWSVATAALADGDHAISSQSDRSRRQCQRGLGGADGHHRHRSASRAERARPGGGIGQRRVEHVTTSPASPRRCSPAQPRRIRRSRCLTARRPLGPVRLTQAGVWSVTTSALAGGVHAITAQATDFAGNVGTTSARAVGHHRHHGAARAERA